MAKKPKAKGMVDPRKARKAEKPGVIWTALAMLALLGALLMLVSVGLADWRRTGTVDVHYHQKNNAVTQNYAPTSYGLYLVRFNAGNFVSPWYTKAQRTCAAVDYMAPLAQANGALNVWASSCDTVCLGHYRTRCNVYKQMSTLGYATMGIIVLGAVIALIGVGWYFILGVTSAVFQVCWTGTGICAIAVLLWWIWSSDYSFKSLNTTSQFPYPSLAYAFFINAVGAAMVFAAGLGSSVGGWWKRRKEWQEKQEKIRKRIIEEAGGLDNPLEPPGMPGALGMGPPGPGGRPPANGGGGPPAMLGSNPRPFMPGRPGFAPPGRPPFGVAPMGARPMLALPPTPGGMRPMEMQGRGGPRPMFGMPPPFRG